MRIFFGFLGLALVFATLGFGLYVDEAWFYAGLLTVPLAIWIFYDMFQPRHSIARNYPVIGRGRYLMEILRPKLYQYFIESDTNGTPISRVNRSVVYTRAKDVVDTSPFGTQKDVYAEGYEWMNHSLAARDFKTLNHHPRVTVGGKDCKQPYSCSLLNVSAMSFGALSWAAVEALNAGAAIGGFAHNTGEGGISPYHEKHGGDLIYQLGTGYFGSRTKEGNFSPEAFAEKASKEAVKMIEIKLSQGAKPGHGGILPAGKNTREIASIRGVEPGTEVDSPPHHTAFDAPISMMEFIAKLRELSGGKPIGFKICIGHKYEFMALCKAMLETDIYPDFISVDGGEGGTGAAPIEFSDSVGMPFREALAFVHDTLNGFGLREEIRILASGKIISGFHMVRAMALGADICYSARAMMLALGCIQALECNKNTCPTGVTTQNPQLVKGLVVSDKKKRVANYHRETLNGFVELLGASGLNDPTEIRRHHINRRVSMNEVKRYNEIFPYLPKHCLLSEETVPDFLKNDWLAADSQSFLPKSVEVLY
jgi:glutamate synthase domain-containing protein 2